MARGQAVSVEKKKKGKAGSIGANTATLTTSTRPARRRVTPRPQAEILLDDLLKAKEALERNFLHFAAQLSTWYHSGDNDRDAAHYRQLGHPNFVDFAEKRLGWKFRSAYNYVSVWDVTEKYGIDEDVAIKVGMSRMILIAGYAGQEKTTKKQVLAAIQIAQETPYSEFKEWVEVARNRNYTPPAPDYVLRSFKLKLPKEQAEFVGTVITKTKELIVAALQSTDPDSQPTADQITDEQALLTILQEYAATKGIDLPHAENKPAETPRREKTGPKAPPS